MSCTHVTAAETEFMLIAKFIACAFILHENTR